MSRALQCNSKKGSSARRSRFDMSVLRDCAGENAMVRCKARRGEVRKARALKGGNVVSGSEHMFQTVTARDWAPRINTRMKCLRLSLQSLEVL